MNTTVIVSDAAYVVLDDLGPGWSESVYQRAMETELRSRTLSFETQRALPIHYRGFVVGSCIPDLIVFGSYESRLVVDLKAVDYLKVGDEVQVQRYVQELAAQVPGHVEGLLINFAQSGYKRKLSELAAEPLQIVTIGGAHAEVAAT